MSDRHSPTSSATHPRVRFVRSAMEFLDEAKFAPAVHRWNVKNSADTPYALVPPNPTQVVRFGSPIGCTPLTGDRISRAAATFWFPGTAQNLRFGSLVDRSNAGSGRRNAVFDIGRSVLVPRHRLVRHRASVLVPSHPRSLLRSGSPVFRVSSTISFPDTPARVACRPANHASHPLSHPLFQPLFFSLALRLAELSKRSRDGKIVAGEKENRRPAFGEIFLPVIADLQSG